MNIPHITEHKAIALFNQKFGTDKITRFLKVREEFREMTEAFSEYLATGNDEHLRDEICDLQATLTHFASLFNMFQKEMLETSMDKVVTREIDSEYKRHRTTGLLGLHLPICDSHIDSMESALMAFERNLGCRVIVLDQVNRDTTLAEKLSLRNLSIELPEIKLNSKYYPTEKEKKPWDRKELNRHSKPSYKKKRR